MTADPDQGVTGRRVAVVTGASSGIGAATARGLAAAGFEVTIVARRMDRLTDLATDIGASAYQLDVTDRVAVGRFAATLPTVDVLVNNAGGAFGADPVATADPADWRAMFDVNVMGSLHTTQALLPKLIVS